MPVLGFFAERCRYFELPKSLPAEHLRSFIFSRLADPADNRGGRFETLRFGPAKLYPPVNSTFFALLYFQCGAAVFWAADGAE